MEVFDLLGYTPSEKVEIVQNHLLPANLESFKIDTRVSLPTSLIREMLSSYTKEAGVREADRCIQTICRKIKTEFIQTGKPKNVKITSSKLLGYLGPVKFGSNPYHRTPSVGVVNGLAWTSVGGQLLVVEAESLAGGKANVSLTGNLGEVMKESIKVASVCVQANLSGFAPHLMEKFRSEDYHFHFPEGATPKDGPSAGIALCTALMSLVLNFKVKDSVAMTGEVTLKGKVLPIGGLREKLLAAYSNGISTVLIPQGNVKDLEDALQPETRGLEIVPVEHVRQVFAESLIGWSHDSNNETVGEKPVYVW
jgi:ATP-dependent Lon protease